MCFNGKAQFVNTLIGYGEMEKAFSGDYYDLDWNRMPFSDGPLYPQTIPAPPNLQEMVVLAEKLAKGIPFVRIDLMCEHGNILLGEMTFTPQAGFLRIKPKEYDEILGNMLTLPSA
jgi:hypothetical protein